MSPNDTRLYRIGHVERKDANDWMSACRNMAVSGESRGRGVEVEKHGRSVWQMI